MSCGAAAGLPNEVNCREVVVRVARQRVLPHPAVGWGDDRAVKAVFQPPWISQPRGHQTKCVGDCPGHRPSYCACRTKGGMAQEPGRVFCRVAWQTHPHIEGGIARSPTRPTITNLSVAYVGRTSPRTSTPQPSTHPPLATSRRSSLVFRPLTRHAPSPKAGR